MKTHFSKRIFEMGSSKNTLTTTLKKIGCLDKIIALGVLIIVMELVCIPRVYRAES
jgi:hypothetical protein